jgi:hypothetical protein
MSPRQREPKISAPQRGGIDEIVRHLTVVGELDVHAAEALELEIRQLATRHGVEITTRRILSQNKKNPESSA